MSDSGSLVPAAPNQASHNGSSAGYRLPAVMLARGPKSPAPRRPDWLVGQLPVGMLDDSFFYRFVSIFQEQAGTYLDGMDNLENVLDPAVAPMPMVRFLAAWLAMPPIDPALDDLYQRQLVKHMAAVRWWRGTRQGLEALLGLLTRGRVEVSENGGVFRQGEAGQLPPQVRVEVESTGWLSEADFIEVVRDEVPANASVELWVGARRIWPREGPAAPEVEPGHTAGAAVTANLGVGVGVGASAGGPEIPSEEGN
jgi:phage tail-like protein